MTWVLSWDQHVRKKEFIPGNHPSPQLSSVLYMFAATTCACVTSCPKPGSLSLISWAANLKSVLESVCLIKLLLLPSRCCPRSPMHGLLWHFSYWKTGVSSPLRPWFGWLKCGPRLQEATYVPILGFSCHGVSDWESGDRLPMVRPRLRNMERWARWVGGCPNSWIRSRC